MNLPDARTFGEQLALRINAAMAPTRGKVAQLETDNFALRGEIAELRGELATVRDTLSAITRPRSAA